ncbi:MAG: redoxin domain-containing protein [Chloroflexota bacterium]
MTEFRSRWEEIQAADVNLYGVSVDSVYSHAAFAEQLGGLPFELLADFERSVVTEWGVRRDDVEGYRGMPTRSVFIIDRDGIVRYAWVRTREQPQPNFDEVIAEAKRIAS